MPILYFVLAAAVVVVDQVVKYLVRTSIPLHVSLSFLPGLDLTYLQNTGAAFSLFNQHTWVLALQELFSHLDMGLFRAGGILWEGRLLAVALAKKVLPKPIGMLSLALLLGGAVGNFIDRLLFGFVTDMFATTFMNFPVFNVADIGVVVGGVLLCIHVIFTYSKEPKPEEKP